MDSATQVEAIKRFSATIHGEAELRKKLDEGRPLRVKYGIDPTAPDVHLGHTVPLRLLKTLMDFGHYGIIIIGNATAKVGDPSGRDETRAGKTPEQVRENADRYLEQIGKVIDIVAADVQYNDRWFGAMTFDGVMTLLSRYTVQQILTRDDFDKRMKSNTPIAMNELMYPLMQGYDSVMMEADIEIGGTEQLFNMNVGRDMLRMWDRPPQVVVTLPILRGTDGTRRMGKSLGNYIGISEQPFSMYSKVMSIPDDLMKEWFSLLTDICPTTVDSFFVLHSPMKAKKILAYNITRQYHGEAEAASSAHSWTKQFTDKGVPDVIEEVFLSRPALLNADGRVLYSTLLKEMGLAESNNKARQLIEQNAVSMLARDESQVDGKFIKVNPGYVKAGLKVIDGDVFKVGRKIRKLRLV